MEEQTQRSWRDPVPHRLWALLGLCAVLSAIGYVQFRWIDEVARAQREHAIAALHASLARFTSEFDTEVARIHFAFQVPMPGRSADMAAVVQYRLRRWRELAPYPRLISDVKVTESDGRIDGPIFQAAAAPLPNDMAFQTGGRVGVVRSGSGQPYVVRTEGPQHPGRMDGVAFSTMGGVGVSVGPAIELQQGPDGGTQRDLAMVMPLMPGIGLVTRQAGRSATMPMPMPMFLGSARVIFDLRYVQSEFIPKLVARAFAEQKSEVQILIVNNTNAHQVVWKSEPDGYAAHEAADLTAPFFALRPGCLVSAMSSGGVVDPGDPAQMPELLLRQILGQRAAVCEQEPLDKVGGSWKISVRYRAGSVDAVIRQFRYRSLGLSAGVLLVLFVAAVMLVVSTERARSLAKTQMEFAAGVSHELRTPLSVIRVAADNLSEGMVTNEAQARRYGSMIAAQVQRLATLVADVLLFSRSEASLEIPGIEAVSVEGILDDALANCAAELEMAGFEVKRDLRAPLPDVLANRHLAAQCLINIVQNALKYARGGKYLAFEAVIGEADGVAGVQIDIVDHGRGIPQEELAHVFEPFYRGREARLSQTSGLGVGLSIVKRIVVGHHGQIRVVSKPNAETRFSIWLPAAGTGTNSEAAGRMREGDAALR